MAELGIFSTTGACSLSKRPFRPQPGAAALSYSGCGLGCPGASGGAPASRSAGLSRAPVAQSVPQLHRPLLSAGSLTAVATFTHLILFIAERVLLLKKKNDHRKVRQHEILSQEMNYMWLPKQFTAVSGG